MAGLFLPSMLVASGVAFAVAQALQGPLLNAILGAAPQVIALMKAAEGAADQVKNLATLAKDLGGEFGALTSPLTTANELLGEFGLSLRDVINLITAPTLAGMYGGIKSDKPNMLQRAGANINDMLFDLGVPVPRCQPTPGPPKPREMEWWLAPPGDPDRTDPDVPRAKGQRPTPGSGESGGGSGSAADMMAGMRLALDSMQREVGGPAQMGSDLTAVWRQATMAGLQEDPIQKEIRDLMIRQVEAAEKMLGEVQRKEAQYRSRS